MYQTSISTCFNYEIPIKEQLKLVHNAGFTHISIGNEYSHSGILDERRLDDLCKQINESGLLVDTVHGYDLDQKDAIDINEKVAKAAHQLKAKIVVVHCSAFMFPDEFYTEKYESVNGKINLLEKLAEKYNIRFAFENVVPGLPTKLCEEMVALSNPKYIGFCYDSSHDQIDGPNNMDLLTRQKDRLIAVHLSDRIRDFVDHVIPGDGFINFDEITPLLKEAKFNGPLLMEVEMTHSQYKEENVFLKKVFEAAQILAKEVNL